MDATFFFLDVKMVCHRFLLLQMPEGTCKNFGSAVQRYTCLLGQLYLSCYSWTDTLRRTVHRILTTQTEQKTPKQLHSWHEKHTKNITPTQIWNPFISSPINSSPIIVINKISSIRSTSAPRNYRRICNLIQYLVWHDTYLLSTTFYTTAAPHRSSCTAPN